MSLFDMYKKGGLAGTTTSRLPTGVPNQEAAPRTDTSIVPLPSSYRLGKIKADVKAARTKVDAMIGKRDLLVDQRTRAETDKAAAEKDLATFDLVLVLLQKTSEYAREQVKVSVEDIISQALNVVFGGGHKFKIMLDVRSGQPVADYYLDDGQVTTKIEKPDYDRGGGKIDVISLAYKLGVGELEGIPGTLFLDEVGKHVSKEYAPYVAYFLKEYCQKFDRQIVLITHNKDLAEIGDIGLEVTQNEKGESQVRRV